MDRAIGKLRKELRRLGIADNALFDLSKDAQEKTDLSAREPQRTVRMKAELEAWQKSVVRSLNGEDYR